MGDIIGRDYCLKNPGKIVKHFGLGVFLGVVFCKKKSLLQRVMETYRSRGIPMPGYVGSAYRISAMIEFRVSRLYAGMAERFRDQKPVRNFFMELHHEEIEHGRLMLLCLYTIALRPHLSFVPSIRDPEIREVTNWLRGLKRKIESLSLEEALQLTEKIEASEVNTIFEKLLKQTNESESRIFRDQMQLLEDHAKTVPLRIIQLRQALR